MVRIIGAMLIVLLIVMPIVLFEFIGKNFLFKNKMYIVDDVDHRLKPRSKADINSDGIRSVVEANSFHEEDLNIVFLGDSFVYGLHLPIEKSIPFMLEAKARASHPEQKINIANFGWVSSSPLLSLRLLKDIGKKYNPDVVMLAIDMTDFHDDIKYLRLFERQGIYPALDFIPTTILTVQKIISKLRLDSLYEKLFGFPRRRFFITDKPLSETRPYFSYIRKNIEAINEYSKRELGAKFILFVFPRGYQYSNRESPTNWERFEYEKLGRFSHEPFKYFEEMEDDVDYPIFSLLRDFQETTVFPTAFYWDGHWNEDGTRVAVEAIHTYCLKAGCFD